MAIATIDDTPELKALWDTKARLLKSAYKQQVRQNKGYNVKTLPETYHEKAKVIAQEIKRMLESHE